MKRKKTKNLVQPDVINELVELRYIKLLHLIRTLILEIENKTDKKVRKFIFREVLDRFLETYSDSVPTLKTKSREIRKYFGRLEKSQLSNNLNECVDDMLKFFLSIQNQVRDIEDFKKFVVSRLLCIYIVLAETDIRGNNMCTSLCKELVGKNWKENTTKRYTLECLGDGHQDIVKRCRFWQKWSREVHGSILLI